MRWLLGIYICACLFASAGARAEQDEAALKNSLRDVVSAAWRAQDMAQVERLAEEFRTTRAMSSTGAWKSRLLHRALWEDVERAALQGESWSSIRERSAHWARVARDVPIAQISYAAVIELQAWSVRGHGYASTVSAENMRTFGRLMHESGDYLDAVKDKAASDPEWYAAKLRCAWQGRTSNEEVWALLVEATAREPGYIPTFYSAMEGFTSRWGGSDDLLEAFIRKAAPLAGKLEEQAYARLYTRVIQSRTLAHFASSKVDCDRVVRGIKAFIVAYPDPLNLNLASRAAGACGDKAFALKLIERIGENPMAEVWGTPPANAFEGLKRWASQ